MNLQEGLYHLHTLQFVSTDSGSEFTKEDKGCFTIRVHFQKLLSSPVFTVEAYFDFKVLLQKH